MDIGIIADNEEPSWTASSSEAFSGNTNKNGIEASRFFL